MSISEIKKGDKLYKKAFELRYLLFFKDHNLPEEIVNDDKENTSMHIAISNKDELIAYGRLSELNDKEFQISQMVVSPIYQCHGYGNKLLLEIVKIANNKGAKNIMLYARITACEWYKKFGFKSGGDVFNSTRTGVAHIKMIYNK